MTSMNPCTSTGPSSVRMTRRRTGSGDTSCSDDHEFLLALPRLDEPAGFERGGAWAHDRAEGHHAAGEDLGVQARVGEVAESGIVIAQAE